MDDLFLFNLVVNKKLSIFRGGIPKRMIENWQFPLVSGEKKGRLSLQDTSPKPVGLGFSSHEASDKTYFLPDVMWKKTSAIGWIFVWRAGFIQPL